MSSNFSSLSSLFGGLINNAGSSAVSAASAAAIRSAVDTTAESFRLQVDGAGRLAALDVSKNSQIQMIKSFQAAANRNSAQALAQANQASQGASQVLNQVT